MKLSWLQNYPSDRSIKVVLSGQASETATINASVPQGSILGLLLFSVLIDDLVDVCEKCLLYRYVDVSNLSAPIKSGDRNTVEASLNRNLQRMKAWADKWKITFEPSKCKIMVMHRKRTPSKLNLFFGNYKLTENNTLEILGVTIASKLLWSKHISTLATRAGQRLGALSKVSNKLDIQSRATVYTSIRYKFEV